MCDGSGMAPRGNSPTGQENAPKPMQACVHSPTMVSSPSPRGLFGSGWPIFLAKWPILLAKHRLVHPCADALARAESAGGPGRVWPVPLPDAAGSPGRALGYFMESTCKNDAAFFSLAGRALQGQGIRDQGAQGERRRPTIASGHRWGGAQGGQGGCMCDAHCESNGWHGEKPTDVGAGGVHTVAT